MRHIGDSHRCGRCVSICLYVCAGNEEAISMLHLMSQALENSPAHAEMPFLTGRLPVLLVDLVVCFRQGVWLIFMLHEVACRVCMEAAHRITINTMELECGVACGVELELHGDCIEGCIRVASKDAWRLHSELPGICIKGCM